MNELLSRDDFRESVLERDSHRCVVCGLSSDTEDLAVHHIIERCLFDGGGYYLDNGATLCPDHHWDAEKTILSCEEIRSKAGILNVVIPQKFAPHNEYDKWGNIIIGDRAIQGSLYDTEQCQKALKGVILPHTFLEWDDISLTNRILKYPRTRHILGSGLQKGDDGDFAGMSELGNKHLVIEEKIDGANTGVSFNSDGEIKLQCRGHFLEGKGDWPEFDQFKVWGSTYQEQLFDLLDIRYIMYGEWMAGFHSVYYDILPHYFMEFDIYDKQTSTYLSTDRRKELIGQSEVPISSVRVIIEGEYDNVESIISNVGLSAFISEEAYGKLNADLTSKNVTEKDVLLSFNTDMLMEGLYVKWEEDGIVKGRYKYVRGNFVQTILDSGQHWKDRPSIANLLKDGCGMFGVKDD